MSTAVVGASPSGCAAQKPWLGGPFFGTPVARDAVRKKVAALFPAHEVELFTELFWRRVQAWRTDHAR